MDSFISFIADNALLSLLWIAIALGVFKLKTRTEGYQPKPTKPEGTDWRVKSSGDKVKDRSIGNPDPHDHIGRYDK